MALTNTTTRSTKPTTNTAEVDRLYRIRMVQELTGLGRSCIYQMVKDGEFPPPVELTPRSRAWRQSDLASWIASRPVARR